MKDCRLYIFTALFFCLTAVKLCFPAVSEQAGDKLRQMICFRADYGEAIQAMGRALGQGELAEAISQLREDTVSALGQRFYQITEAAPSPAS